MDMPRLPVLATCVAVSSALLFTACTDLEVTRLSAGAASENAEGVIPYVLPKKTLFISATYVLKDCGSSIKPGTADASLKLDADIKIELVATNEADESERYTIPYVELSSWLKETSFTLESYGNKTLKSFNGTINDQTASVVSAVINTAIKTAALVAAAAGGTDIYCTNDVKSDLSSIAQFKKAIADLREKSKATKPPAGVAEKKVPTVAKSGDAANSANASADESKIAEYQALIDKTITEKLTTKVSLVWSPSLSEVKNWYPGRDAAIRVLKPDVAVGKWLTAEGRQKLAANSDRDLNINIVVSMPTWAHPPISEDKKLEEKIKGFVVRDPAFATVFVCKGVCPAPQDGLMLVDNIVSTADAAFPQLGRKLVLPLHNSIGQNSVLDVSLSEDGVITKLGPHSTSTAAAGITALGGSLDAEKAQIDARNKLKSDAQTAAQNKPHDDNKRLAECLAAQKTILENGGTPIGSCQ